MMRVVRAEPPEGEDPWLIPQFGPNTTDPMSATHLRNTKKSCVQMSRGRQNLLKEYPMHARFNMSACSYASRRAGSNPLALMGASSAIRNAHGNWKAEGLHKAMADVYTEEKDVVSAKAKVLVALSIQLAIKRLNRTDFRWGDIPPVVPQADRDKILDKAFGLNTDVRVPERKRVRPRQHDPRAYSRRFP